MIILFESYSKFLYNFFSKICDNSAALRGAPPVADQNPELFFLKVIQHYPLTQDVQEVKRTRPKVMSDARRTIGFFAEARFPSSTFPFAHQHLKISDGESTFSGVNPEPETGVPIVIAPNTLIANPILK